MITQFHTLNIEHDGSLVLVDDDADFLQLCDIAYRQSRHPHTLVTLDSGTALLSHLEHVAQGEYAMPALMFIDLRMPRFDGLETLDAIRAQPAFAHAPPIIMLSGADNDHDLAEARQRGADGFALKPYDLKDYQKLFAMLD